MQIQKQTLSTNKGFILQTESSKTFYPVGIEDLMWYTMKLYLHEMSNHLWDYDMKHEKLISLQ